MPTLDAQVFVVAVIDALYHAWDPVLGIDCQATPYMTLLDQDPSRLFMTRTVIYNIVQEVRNSKNASTGTEFDSACVDAR